jgi:hypothetical protein
MISVTFDMTRATEDEILMGSILIDMVSNRLPMSMLEVNVIQPEIINDTPELPFLFTT